MPRLVHTYERLIKWGEKHARTDLRYVLHGASWLLFGQVVGVITALSLAVGYANLLPKEVYGTYKYLLSVFGILSLFSLTGMDGAVQRGIAGGKDAIFWKTFKLRIKASSAAVLTCAGFGVYYFLEGNRGLAELFFVSAPFLLILDPLSHYNSLLAGKKLFREASTTNIIQQVGTTLIILGVICFSKSALGLTLAYLLGTILLRGVIFFYVTRHHPLNSIEDHESLQFGKHWSVMAVFATITGRLDAILLFHFLGPAALAVYSFAQAAVSNIQNSFKLVTTTLAFPKMAGQDKGVIKRTLLRKVRIAHYITVPLSILAFFLVPTFFHILFPKYLDSIPFAQVMVLLLAFTPLRFISTAVTAKATVKAYYTLTITSSVVSSICLLICIPLWGIWGAIIATMIQQVISNMLGLYLFKRM